MVGGLFHFGRALEKKPLILATLFHSFLFTIWVALFAAIESALRGLFLGTGFAGAMDHLLSEGVHELYAKCLVVFVAFIPFFAFKELGRVLGKGKIWEWFFRKGPVEEGLLLDQEGRRLTGGKAAAPPH
jgi:ABC-type dipeptide/oligopeptide/nickel transport system permease component